MPLFQAMTRSRNGVSRTGARTGRSKTWRSQSFEAWSIAALTTATASPRRISGPDIGMTLHCSAAARCVPFAQRLGVARRHIRKARLRADARQDLPRARATLAVGTPHLDRDARNVIEPEGAGWPLGLDQGCSGRDRDLGEIDVDHRLEQLRVAHIDHRIGFERGADALGGALDLERAGDHAAYHAHLAPLLGERVVAPGGRDLRELLEVHRAFWRRIAREPGLLRRKRQH